MGGRNELGWACCALMAGCASGTLDGGATTDTSHESLAVGADTLLGVHFADLAGGDLQRMMDGRRGFTVEMAYATEADAFRGHAPFLRALADAGLTVIFRIDYARGQNIPPPGAGEEYLAFIRDTVMPEIGGHVSIFVVGNEPNLDIECRMSGGRCDPGHYAEVYRRARAAGHERADSTWLIAGMSPGGPAGERYLGGDDYLRRVLALLSPGEVDGVALHAYGGGDEESSVGAFVGTMEEHFATLADTGYGSAPLFITEMNRHTAGGDTDEAVTARFLRRAYRYLHEHNEGGDHDIVGACWFVYADSADWHGYSLYGLRSGGDHEPALEWSDVWHAFRATARQGYPPGAYGSASETAPPPDEAPPGGDPPPPPAEEPPPGEEPPPVDEPEAGGGDAGDGDCRCTGSNNFCHHPPRTDGCGMTFPGGYCDPDGDGSYDDADWGRGFAEHADACSTGGVSCPCTGSDNYCHHPPGTGGCAMTMPGGYCDPNGNGSYDDADWERGWYEHLDACG